MWIPDVSVVMWSSRSMVSERGQIAGDDIADTLRRGFVPSVSLTVVYRVSGDTL